MDKAGKIPNRLRFMIAMFVLYLLSFFTNPVFTKDIFISFIQTLVKILPVILLVFIIIFFVNLWVKPKTIKKHFGRESGIRGWIYAIAGSILIVGPPYVLYPLFAELRKEGMKDSLIIAFFNNRNVQPAFLPVMVYYFGLAFTLTISFYIILFSFINGFLVGKILKKTE